MSRTNEIKLTPKLVKYLTSHLPSRYVVRKHADYATSGDPDISITGDGKTTWWEVKYANPKVKWANELQRVKCVKLAEAGYCRLIVFCGKDEGSTHIVHPENCTLEGRFQSERVFEHPEAFMEIEAFVLGVHRETRGRTSTSYL